MEYKPQMMPRDYQTKANKKMWLQPAFALLMAMRTGKTKVLLDDYGRLENEGLCNDLLVIAPTGVYLTWVTAIDEHLSDDLLKRVKIGTWKSGPSAKQKAQLLHFLLNKSNAPRILLVGVEALSTVKAARKACEDFLSTDRISMIAIDESTTIKNDGAKRTEYIINNLSQNSNYRRILTGLPTPKSPLDLYSQMNFLDRSILKNQHFVTFRARYCKLRPVQIGIEKFRDKYSGKIRVRPRVVQSIVGYRNENELRSLIEPFSFRVPFRPKIPSTWSKWDVELTKEQEQIYKNLKEQAFAELERERFVNPSQVITLILRLHQVVCGHIMDNEKEIHTIPENKTKELLKILDDYAGKAIIWCSYDHDVQKLAKVIAKEHGPESVARFWGGNIKTREAEEKRFKEKRFKENANCRFNIATPAAGGRGRTWDMADLTIYYSSTNNLEHRDQSEQRGMAVDKEQGMDFIDLICPNTVEEKIIEALRAKIDMATAINGDNYKEWLI